MHRGVAYVDVPNHLKRRKALNYSTQSVEQIAELPVGDIAATDCVLFLWTTNRYIEAAYDVARTWGFRPSQLLTWCKTPRGIGPGGAFASTTEFIIYARQGTPKTNRVDSTWWHLPRAVNGAHSEKPAGFLDIVQQVSPGPYVELFARQQRLGWDGWGHGIEVLSAKAETEAGHG
jgi:N6-adenosine-specific RNA methylase IME4